MINDNQKISQFIDDLDNIDPPKAVAVRELMEIFDKSKPKMAKKFIYGGIGYFVNDTIIGGIWVSKHHVSVTFSEGKSFKDPDHLLLGTGKYRGYLKITGPEMINSEIIKGFISQAVEIELGK